MSPASSSSSVPRVLFVDVSGRRGGAETSLDELIAALMARRSAVLALATARAHAAVPCPTHALPAVRLHRPSHPLPFLRSLAALPRARRALGRLVRDFKPDIIHANGIAAVLALPPTRARVFWHVRDWPRRPYAALAARRCVALVATSRPVEGALRRTLRASLHSRIRLVENGIDLRRFVARGGHSAGCAVGMVAHLVPWKRHDLFIAAAALLKDFRDSGGNPITWIIAGSDLFGEHAVYVASLRQAIATAGLTERFVWLDGRDMPSILPELDLLVHPTPAEPFGRVICEAMAGGIPVVACDAAGPGSILADNETGFLFPPSDSSETMAAALAERIRFALTHGKERESVTQAASEKVRDRYSVERVAIETEKLFRLAGIPSA